MSYSLLLLHPFYRVVVGIETAQSGWAFLIAVSYSTFGGPVFARSKKVSGFCYSSCLTPAGQCPIAGQLCLGDYLTPVCT